MSIYFRKNFAFPAKKDYTKKKRAVLGAAATGPCQFFLAGKGNRGLNALESKGKRACGQQQRLEAVRPSMPDTSVLYDLSDFFKVMGDGTRIQLLWALEQDELCVGDLAALLNMTTSAVSHQLRALRTAKLIRSRKEGKNVYYSLNDAHVKDILEKALEHLCER